MVRRLATAALALAGIFLPGTDGVRAAEVQVNPVVVSLAAGTRSAIVTVRNQGTAPVRFELQARAWQQGDGGEMIVEPTNDLAVYPPVLSLGPGEERNVRVGAATSFGSLEKTYRVFLQEMPAPEKPEAAAQVRVLSRIGIPVFLAPGRAVERAGLEGLAAAGGKATFRLVNGGTVHVRPTAVKLVGRSADGGVLLERELAAWYVLAGGSRTYDVVLPAQGCEGIRALEASVELPRETLRARIDVAGACAR